MIRCILEHRLATPDEIRAATPRSVLKSWRAVWKDRNEDTAYVTGWKRIQEKLTAHVDSASGFVLLLALCARPLRVLVPGTSAVVLNTPSHLMFLLRRCRIGCSNWLPNIRAGEPVAKKSRMLKREPYASKRCGCGFRIRAIVPITNYNEKDKTFVYQEEGMAVFKLYAVHSGHEPGPLDGNARIMHRVVGHKGSFMMDQEMNYGVHEDVDNDGFGLMGKDEGDLQLFVLQQVQELRTEIGLLEGRLRKIPSEFLGLVSQELFHVVNKVRSIGEDSSKTIGLLSHKPHSNDVLVGENDLPHWGIMITEGYMGMARKQS
ncbi:hypothetical protein GH714_018532 [Hevea brasiliensis]|uniref:Uncharacterized protein n=1 Tax=Hevea brasiliensis TaxID=3981 RepID=A0A6A6LCA6_HEVBR|nr:hypothetical protein GH714_018532 [Hevea brasiliensis]